jgi:hypothetical protein
VTESARRVDAIEPVTDLAEKRVGVIDCSRTAVPGATRRFSSQGSGPRGFGGPELLLLGALRP